ncbi:MAG: sensor histidine kinase [Methylobacteriaceae bacterium]|nr:sensor histidine kinase [Methylobacteriaceae bacterium]
MRLRLYHFAWLLHQAFFSTLTRQIVVLNLAGLFALLVGVLFLNQFRAGLIDARIQSLITQGEIIAGAIANTATLDTDVTRIDPDRLWELQTGESGTLSEDYATILDFSINPERVAPVLRRLVTPTRTRARVYDREGFLLIDSQALFSQGDILRIDLPPLAQNPDFFQRIARWYRNLFRTTPSVITEIGPAIGNNLPEVQRALAGYRNNAVHLNRDGDTIVSVAIPITRLRTVRGVLLLSTQSGDIDSILSAERHALIRIFLVAAFVMIVLSLFLAQSIVLPVRRLSEAAEKVRSGAKHHDEIPDFSQRSDEIGHLSESLREMTAALFNRIEAIERFAADVAHELKNPLTSVRSAVETLPVAKTADARERLFSIIQHDVQRMNRLISDISAASRLDAELARDDTTIVDLRQLLEAVVQIANSRDANAPAVTLTVTPLPDSSDKHPPFLINGHDSRLAQVFNNLIDNARSFSPPDKPVMVTLSTDDDIAQITVDDFGPGIPAHALEKVFERFYTDRPNQGFGQNSGLGLAISRQIIEAHRGTIIAENRYAEPSDTRSPIGARFLIRIPVI